MEADSRQVRLYLPEDADRDQWENLLEDNGFEGQYEIRPFSDYGGETPKNTAVEWTAVGETVVRRDGASRIKDALEHLDPEIVDTAESGQDPDSLEPPQMYDTEGP